jgi:gamma-glutamyltranspeptidase/glutathione hydrolase
LSHDAQGLPNANAPAGGKRPRRTALGGRAAREALGGKRPRSSMSPTIVLRRNASTGVMEPLLAIGCPGGSTIIGATSNALLGRLVHGLPLQTAIDLPRVIARNNDKPAIAEEALCSQWPSTCGAGLAALNYSVTTYHASTLVQAAELTDDGGLVAAADTLRIDSGACGVI